MFMRRAIFRVAYPILNWLSWFTIPGAGYNMSALPIPKVNLRGRVQDEVRWFGYTMIGRI